MAGLRRIGTNVTAQMVAMVASTIERILLVGLMLRAWGTDLFADYAVLQSWASLLLIGEFGIQIYVQAKQQAAATRGDWPAFQRLAAFHAGLMWLLAGGLAIVGLALLPFAGGLVQSPGFDAASVALVLAMLGASSLFQMMRATATTIFTALGDFSRIVLAGAAIQVAATVAALVAVAAGGGPVTVAALSLLINGPLAHWLVMADLDRRHPGRRAAPARPTRVELAELRGHLAWLGLVSVAPLVWLQAPVLAFGAAGVVGAEIAAFLLLRTLVNLLRQCFQFAALGAGLEIVPHAHAGDFPTAWRLSGKVGRATSALAGAAAAGMLCFGPATITLWAGTGTLYAAPLAALLVLPVAAAAPFHQILALLQYSNRSRIPGLHKVVQLGAGALLVPAGLVIGGVTGVAAGLAVAEVAAAVAIVPLLVRSGLFPGLGRYLALSIGAMAAAAAWAGAIGLLVVDLMPTGAFATLAFAVAAWGLVGVLPPMLATLPGTLRLRLLAAASRLRR